MQKVIYRIMETCEILITFWLRENSFLSTVLSQGTNYFLNELVRSMEVMGWRNRNGGWMARDLFHEGEFIMAAPGINWKGHNAGEDSGLTFQKGYHGHLFESANYLILVSWISTICCSQWRDYMPFNESVAFYHWHSKRHKSVIELGSTPNPVTPNYCKCVNRRNYRGLIPKNVIV